MSIETEKSVELVDIPDIVKQHILIHNKRMPQTQLEVDQYLDLINHAKEYAKSYVLSRVIGIKMMKKLGIKTPSEIKKEGQKLFNQP